MVNFPKLSKLALYYHSLKWLKPGQLAQQVWQRIKPATRLPANLPALSPATWPTDWLWLPQPGAVTPGRWCFLNQPQTFSNAAIDWQCLARSKLWRYNLHYFDYLQEPALPLADKVHFINDWILRVKPGQTDAWEAYPVSLRIMNWVRFFLQYPHLLHAHPHWLPSFYRQAYWLYRNLERHLLANHYLKNLLALLMAGLYLNGAEAKRWRRRASRALKQQLAEQFLADGGYYERSPMYHCLVLHYLLDLCQLMERAHQAGRLDPMEQDLFEQLQAQAGAASGFLASLLTPGGDFPLFNDSAFGIATNPHVLLSYAQRLLGDQTAGEINRQIPQFSDSLAPQLVWHRPSGLVIVRHKLDYLAFNLGQVGPDYQPGHTHCDRLGFELHLDGKPWLTDTGVYEYQAGARRDYCRSTAAHNCLRIDGAEQSEIWAEFRVARRARIADAFAEQSAQQLSFGAGHKGYQRLTGRPTHYRRFVYQPQRCAWYLHDRVTGAGDHRLEWYFHAHPDHKVVIHEAYIEFLEPTTGRSLRMQVPPGLQASKLSTEYFPQFGQSIKRDSLRLSVRTQVPVEFEFVLEKSG